PDSRSALRAAADLPADAPPGAWRAWVARNAANRDGTWLARILRAEYPPAAVRDAVAQVLWGVEEEAQLRASQQLIGQATIQRPAVLPSLHAPMLRLLPGPHQFESFLAAWVGDSVGRALGPDDPHSTRVLRALRWAEGGGQLPHVLAELLAVWPADEELR